MLNELKESRDIYLFRWIFVSAINCNKAKERERI